MVSGGLAGGGRGGGCVLMRSTELHVKTVKYFKSIERVQDEVEEAHAKLLAEDKSELVQNIGSME